MADGGGLSDEEREELEQLLEPGREADLEAELRDARLRERGRQMMQPDEDDLRMAPGQKAVILCVVAVAAVWLIASLLG